jgi:dTDP-4-dehydrorhamnose reductase
MTAPLRLVVTGRHGQVTRSLQEIAAAGSVQVVAVGRPQLELTQGATVEAAIAPLAPDVIVNAAGYTDTEKAELEPELARVVNVEGAYAVAMCARRLGVPLIHLSSSYVFDGQSTVPYREDAPLNPLGAYGKTKAEAEAVVATAHADHIILRTSLVFSPFGRNSLTSLLKRAEQQGEVRVVTDQTVNPTAAFDLADGVIAVARNLMGARNDAHFGIFHLTNRGAATPAEFAAALFACSARHGGTSAQVVPITAEQYGSRVRRPVNSELDCGKIAAVHGVVLPPWEPQLRVCVERLAAGRQ